MTLKGSFSEECLFLKNFRQDWVYLWHGVRDEAFSPGTATGHFQQKTDVNVGEFLVWTNISINKLVIFIVPFVILVPWGIMLSELWNVLPLLSKITKSLHLIHICQIIWIFLEGSNNHYFISRRLLKKVSGQYYRSEFTCYHLWAYISVLVCSNSVQTHCVWFLPADIHRNTSIKPLPSNNHNSWKKEAPESEHSRK